jgi:hypothetical protein
MLSFSISYWDLIKFHYFEDTTERGDRVWKRGWLYRNFNVCKMNDGMSWQGAWESTMKHDNVLNLSLSWCEILGELERKTLFIYWSILEGQQSGLLGEKSGSKQYTWEKTGDQATFLTWISWVLLPAWDYAQLPCCSYFSFHVSIRSCKSFELISNFMKRHPISLILELHSNWGWNKD